MIRLSGSPDPCWISSWSVVCRLTLNTQSIPRYRRRHERRRPAEVLAPAAAVEIVRTLRQRGFQSYLVGGCVRDLLLGREPADYDVATDATPRQVMSIFPRTYEVGAQFGVVLVPVSPRGRNASAGRPDGSQQSERLRHGHPGCIEVATFRNDGIYSDGRHPDLVSFAHDPREDVQRRDFTINGLLLDPLATSE